MRERSEVPIDEDEMLTPQEAADILKVHPYTVYEMLKSYRLKGFKLRTRWRIRRSALEDFISKNSNTKGK